ANYADPKTVEFALKEWGEVFKKLPRIDAVFVPGGDPGHTQPKYLMALLEKQAANLRNYHPKAQMWVSPQSFTKEWMDEFLAIVHADLKHTVGFIAYSEGCNDDVNKMVWSGLGWDPDADVLTILRDYSRYFLGPRYTETFAQGLLALERNWHGPVATNAGILT